MDTYDGMWVNPMSASPRAQVMRNYVQDMSRKSNETAFFSNNSGASTWGTGSSGSSDYASEQARQAKLAAAAQMKAANQMFQLQAGQRKQGRRDIQAGTRKATEGMNPWREAGVDALGRLQEKITAGPGDFEKSPGYEFRLAEGQRALESSASARGGALSGAAVKGAMRYGQDFATNDYDNFLRRYYESMAPDERMSGKGQEAAGTMGQFEQQGGRDLASSGQASTNQMASARQYGGESEAGGIMNAGNIMAIDAQARAERDYGYDAWKQGRDF